METIGIKRLSYSEETVSALCGIENACFTVPWTRADFESALLGGIYDVFGCFKGDALFGFIVFLSLYEDCELMDLAVLPEARRAGAGGKLLEKCVEEASKKGAERIFLEVREHNPAAIALYEKSGFTMYGKRKNYYQKPTEDALLYVKNL